MCIFTGQIALTSAPCDRRLLTADSSLFCTAKNQLLMSSVDGPDDCDVIDASVPVDSVSSDVIGINTDVESDGAEEQAVSC